MRSCILPAALTIASVIGSPTNLQREDDHPSPRKLTQYDKNDKSTLCTSYGTKLPHWLEDWREGPPWHYDFVIAEQMIAPDGVVRPGIVINGAFPGPTSQANWGDWIEVTVHNNLSEGKSLHWHGILQRETPWFDGVLSVQQCPIAPDSHFVYRFRADLYGSTFYHSHYSAQYTSGVFGALIIHGPHDNAEYDEDLGPVLLTDYYHSSYQSIVEQVMAPAAEKLPPPLSNNNLINGKMNYPCANATAHGLQCTPNAGVSKFFVESGKTYRLRLINGGGQGIQKFSIDGHKLKIIANDFVPVEPYDVDVVTLGVGQRTDIVIQASGKPTDAVWMRSTLGKSALVVGDAIGCTLNDGVSPEAVAAIYYEQADSTGMPTTTSSVKESEIDTCANDSLEKSVPYLSLTPDPTPETIHYINTTFQSNGTHNLFYMNNSTFRADYNSAILLQAKLGDTNFSAEANVHDFGDSKSIRLIMYDFASGGAHPMHIHGHNFYVLASGTGFWDGTITNAHNPQRRDTHLMPNAVSEKEPGYMVIQIDADNPGVWPLHCHVAWHLSAGMYINILERPDDIEHEMEIPSIMAQTCRDWVAWPNGHITDEIDSGL